MDADRPAPHHRDLRRVLARTEDDTPGSPVGDSLQTGSGVNHDQDLNDIFSRRSSTTPGSAISGLASGHAPAAAHANPPNNYRCQMSVGRRLRRLAQWIKRTTGRRARPGYR